MLRDHSRLNAGWLPLLLLAAAAAAARTRDGAARRPARCTMEPGRVEALVRVERDTMLPLVTTQRNVYSFSTPARAGTRTLAGPDTPMPSARVRVLKLDDETRRALVAAGIRDTAPLVWMQAQPYGADCRILAWSDTTHWVRPGETGYVGAHLAPREQWIDGMPVLIVPEAWRFPYPQRYAMVLRAPGTLASADAMYEFNRATGAGTELFGDLRPDSITRKRVTDFALANAAESEREPLRMSIRRTVLIEAFRRFAATPSPLRGSYRVSVRVDDDEATWWFRTFDRPTSPWSDRDTMRTTADVIRSPEPSGYVLVGIPATEHDSLTTDLLRRRPSLAMASLSVARGDRGAAPARGSSVRGIFAFELGATPQRQWPALAAWTPPMASIDSMMLAGGISRPPGSVELNFPVTLGMDGRGGVTIDTTVTKGGRTLRLRVERTDSIAIRQP